MLVVASATAPEIRAWRLDTLRRRFDDAERKGAHNALGGSSLFDFEAFARERAPDENRPAVVMAEGLAAVNQFVAGQLERHVSQERSEVEETQPRNAIVLEQALLQELPLERLDLRRGHLAAMRRKSALNLLPQLRQ